MTLYDTLAMLEECHARAMHMLAECPPRRQRSGDAQALDGLGYSDANPAAMPRKPAQEAT